MADWRNRIVGYDVVEADQLLANPSNWRVHPKAQQDALTGILDDVGWVQEIIVNKVTGHVVDGHMRVEVAITRGESVPVKYVELSEDEEKLILATIDPISAMAATDAAQLEALLADVNSDSAAVQAMLAQLAENAGLFLDNGEPTPDAGAQIDRAEELLAKWQVERGQLWVIPSKSGRGEHRLLCGDSTNAEDVARVMAGERAQMMFTDPPYGVDYTGGHFHSGDVNIKRERDRLSGDSDAVLYHDFLPVVMPMVDGPCYMWFASSKSRDVYNALHESKCEVHALIIWNKINATYAAMNAQYKQRHEPCVYFKPKGSTLRWVGASDECTVWDIKRDGQNEFHPTQKPVELAFRAIKNHDATTVLDCFAGSGFVFVACEQTGRLGRGLELEPKYCAVILERLADMGLQPKLAE